MASRPFHFKQFSVFQERSALKVCTESCLFGAYVGWIREIDFQELPIRVLDIGSGNGLLSLMLAQKWKNARFTALEPHLGSFLDCRENFGASPFSERLEILEMPFQSYNPHAKFDVLVCNPPFFANHLKSPAEDRNKAMHLDKKDWMDWLLFFKNSIQKKGEIFLLLPPTLVEFTLELLPTLGLRLKSEMVFHQKKNKNWRKVLNLSLQNDQVINTFETYVFEEDQQLSELPKIWLSDYYLKI